MLFASPTENSEHLHMFIAYARNILLFFVCGREKPVFFCGFIERFILTYNPCIYVYHSDDRHYQTGYLGLLEL
jgi:hypothetical protein